MFMTTGFTPLLVNLESLKWAAKTASHGKSRWPSMQIRSYTGYGKEQLHIARVATLLQTSVQVFERLLAPGNLGGEDACIAYSRCWRINALYKGRGQGREGSL